MTLKIGELTDTQGDINRGVRLPHPCLFLDSKKYLLINCIWIRQFSIVKAVNSTVSTVLFLVHKGCSFPCCWPGQTPNH